MKFYWGAKELFLPVYKNMLNAMHRHPEARVLVNFASLRVAYDVCMEAMQVDCIHHHPSNLMNNSDETENNSGQEPQIKCIAVIAEGIPENFTRRLIQRSKERNVLLIGPATVSACL
ncbi:unnamed protein product [Trichobilharzia regenti]|nr:unnamed protein product [Trichobilharzia regenti]